MSEQVSKRFSQVYISRGEPDSDSVRMRRRILRTFTGLKLNDYVGGDDIERVLGVEVEAGSWGYRWETFFTNCSLRDFLDTITIVAEIARQKRLHSWRLWIEEVEIVFREENVCYRVDGNGSVHFTVDAEFERNQVSALAALNAPRYGAARSHYEAGKSALDQTPPQTREAIRQTFECNETLFKLMFPSVTSLGCTEATKKLRPLIDQQFAGTELAASGRMLEAFSDWINSAHPYRHGQSVEVPDNPSVQTAVLSVSLGAAFARWLAELDARMAGERSGHTLG